MCGIAAAAIAVLAMALPGLAQAEIQRPDPQVTVTQDPAGPLVPGQTVAFDVNVKNEGGSPTPNDTWRFSIGSFISGNGLEFISVDSDDSYYLGISGPCQWYNSNAVNCGRFPAYVQGGDTTLAPGESAPTIRITARVEADAPPTISNFDTSLAIGNNYTDSVTNTINVTQSPVMQLSMEHTGIFRRGLTGNYNIDVTNASDSVDATAPATITDTLPEGLTYAGASSDGNYWDCSASSGQNVSCVGNAPLLQGEAAPTLHLEVNVAADAADEVTNEATADTAGNGGIGLSSDTDETPIFSADAERAVFKVGATAKADPENGVGSYFSLENPTMDINPLSGDFSATNELKPQSKPVMTGVIDGDSVFISEDSIDFPEFTGPVVLTELPATYGKIPTTQVHTKIVPTDDWTGTVDGSGNISLEMPSRFDYDVTLLTPLEMQFAACESGPVDLSASGTFTSGNGVLSGDDFTVGAATCSKITGQLYGNHLTPVLAGVFLNQWMNTAGGSAAGEAQIRLETHLTDPAIGPALDLENTARVGSAAPTVKVVDGEVDPAGSGGTYDLTVTNTGSSDTAGVVTIAENLPTGASFGSASSAGDYWDCSASAGTSVSCVNDGSPIAAGDSAPTLELKLNLGEAAYPALTTVAQASGGGATGNTSTPNRSNVRIDGALLSVGLIQIQRNGAFFGGESHWTVGAPKNYLEVTPSVPFGSTVVAGDKVNLRIKVPDGATFDRIDPPIFGSVDSWSCSTEAPMADGSSILNCTVNAVGGFFGYGFSGANLVFDLGHEAAAGESPVAMMKVQAWLTGSLPSSDVAESTRTPVVNPHFNLSMVEAGDFRVGGSGGSFTLGLTNDGTGSTTDNPTTITDVLPQGLIVESIDDGGYWDCSTSQGQRVTCDNASSPPLYDGNLPVNPFDGELGPGVSPPPIVIDFSVDQPSTPVVTNGARAVSAAAETGTASTKINTGRPTLSVNSTHSGDFTVGENGSYRLLVSNSGAADTDGSQVTVTDTLPAGLSYVGSSSAGDYWSCAAEGAAVSCTSDAVIEGNSSAPVLRLAVGVADEAVPGVTNLVRVTGGGSLAANASDQTAVNPQAKADGKPRLARVVVKPKARNLRKGKKAVFKVKVKNNGDAKAKRVKVCAKFPKRLLRVQGKACKQLGQLKPGQAKTRKFKVRLRHKGLHRKTIQVRFKANARQVKPRTGKAKIKVRGSHKNH